MSETITFTVFTPTFNRAYTLPMVYNCLRNQTYRDFEWLIVDDGSSDGTEELIRTWQKETLITIRYFYQSNAGKHVAFNRGVAESKGTLFLTLDSDDTCLPNALERFNYHWQQIPSGIRSGFSGVTCLCADKKGVIIGDCFPSEVFDSDAITVTFLLRIKGDKWGFHSTKVLREFPFPLFEGERFVTEGLVWNRIACKYKLRFVNEPLRCVEYLADGLTASSIRIRSNNPKGTTLYYSEFMSLPSIPWTARLKASANLWRFSFNSKYYNCIKRTVLVHPLLCALALPIGIIATAKDRINKMNSHTN